LSGRGVERRSRTDTSLSTQEAPESGAPLQALVFPHLCLEPDPIADDIASIAGGTGGHRARPARQTGTSLGALTIVTHIATLYGPTFLAGALLAALATGLLTLSLLRRLLLLVLLLALLLVSADASFAFDIGAEARQLWQAVQTRPAAAAGVVPGIVIALLLTRRRRSVEGGAATRPSGLRRLIVLSAVGGVVALKLLLPFLVDEVANSPVWGLPDKTLTRQTLTHCQIDHTGGSDVLLCPAALQPQGFSDALRRTVIASEDRNFFYHDAVDIHGAARAGRDLLSGTREGASTLTQQLARVLFLERDQPLRKAFEAVMAQRIFDVATQDEILNAYLNVATLPRNMHGFDAAGRFYFGVAGSQLNLAESALLVGMLPLPAGRDIAVTAERTKLASRRREAQEAAIRILTGMQDAGFATPKEVKAAIAEVKARLARGSLRRGGQQLQPIEFRPYRDAALASAKAAGLPLGGSYRLVIEMDPALQAGVVGATSRMAGSHQGAGILMQPSGEVLAISGSGTYQGTWNRALEIGRSVGSAAKVLPLIAATEAGATPTTQLAAGPLRSDGWPREPDGACIATSLPLATAIAHSCNRPFVRLTARYQSRVEQLLADFGLPAMQDLSQLAVGGLETSPAKLAVVYATIANRGARPTPGYVIGAFGPNGNVLSPAARPSPAGDGPQDGAVLTPPVAAKVLADLRIPVKSGTATAANSSLVTVYGKTGTSNDSKDSVFAGIVQGGFVGVFWLGDDQPLAIAGAHGGGAPAVAFREVVDGYYSANPVAAPDSGASLFRWQMVVRNLIQWAAAFGFSALVANWTVRELIRRRQAPPGPLAEAPVVDGAGEPPSEKSPGE